MANTYKNDYNAKPYNIQLTNKNMEQISNQQIAEKLKNLENNMISKQEFIETIETLSVSSNKETLDQIKESEQDISDGKTREINSIEDL